MKFSLVVSTKGRTSEFERLLESLANQTFQDFEVIISDQNDDDRLISIIKQSALRGKLVHVKSSGGAARGRNIGIGQATGEILGFPDDDCKYPDSLLAEVIDFFEAHPEYGYVTGRSFADDGKYSVSRHAEHASPITKMTILTKALEFAFFLRRAQLGDHRFDENMGTGAPTLWQSDEGPDLMLRLEEAGVHGYYDPRFAVWHDRPIIVYNAEAIERSYRYGCGTGFFLRKHDYPLWFLLHQTARSLGGLCLALLSFNIWKARLYLARIRGRWKGWSTEA